MIAGQLAWQDEALSAHAPSTVAARSEEMPRPGINTTPDHEEVVRCVLLQMTLCGALINRDAVEFARGIAEVLVWSAEHARVRATQQPSAYDVEAADWPCVSCGASVPNNFDICWNCQSERPDGAHD